MPVAPLMLKCAQHAIQLFDEMLLALGNEDHPKVAQKLEDRTCYFSTDLPRHFCGVIDWRCDAEDIDQLCRALDYGDLENPFYIPKVRLGDEICFVPSVVLTNCASTLDPGTLVEVSPKKLTVSTSTMNIEIRRIVDCFSRELDMGALIKKYDLKQGGNVNSLVEYSGVSLLPGLKKAVKNEKFWVAEYRKCSFVSFDPLVKDKEVASQAEKQGVFPKEFFEEFVGFRQACVPC